MRFVEIAGVNVDTLAESDSPEDSTLTQSAEYARRLFDFRWVWKIFTISRTTSRSFAGAHQYSHASSELAVIDDFGNLQPTTFLGYCQEW